MSFFKKSQNVDKPANDAANEKNCYEGELVDSVRNALFSAPYLSEYDTSDREVYEGSVKLREVLINRSEDDPHIINKKNLQNVWILTEYYDANDDIVITTPCGNPIRNPYLLISSNTKVGTMERLTLVGELFSYVPHEYAFEINAHNFSSPSSKEYADICSEIIAGRVRKIYDKEDNT